MTVKDEGKSTTLIQRHKWQLHLQ